MEKEITVNVTAQGNELIIRQGEALDVSHKSPITINGTLEAPYQFYAGKKGNGEFEPNDCHIEIQKNKGIITLIVNDQHPFSKSVITGSLTPDSDLKKFQINSDTHRYTIADFIKFIKQFKFYFADKTAHANLVQSLQKWSVKVERVINEQNDGKGNSNFQLQTKVQQSANGEDGLIQKFDLLIPIFQGYGKQKFTVEIGLDPTSTLVKVFLISDELFELEAVHREKLIQDEIDKFSEFPCSKVVLS